jgi:transcriptional regulator with XRE-family HTH domain
MTLGERLRQLRAVAGLSQNELHKRSGVSQAVISAVERDLQDTITLATATRLADALGVSLDLLAGRTGERH